MRNLRTVRVVYWVNVSEFLCQLTGLSQRKCLSSLLMLLCLVYLPPTKEEVNAFARIRLSICLLARLLKNACMDLDEMLRADRCRDMDRWTN